MTSERKVEEYKEKYCKKCINGDDKGNCIAKEESPFDSFLCDNGEQFELYDE